MTIQTKQALNGTIRSIKTNAKKFRELVQEALISCAFYAYKDGNMTPFNDLLAAVGNGTHIQGITRWIELVSMIGRVKDKQIVLNKKVRDQSGVIDEKTFAPFEADMRAGAPWFEVAGKQQPESVFDEGQYMKRVYKKLADNGYPGLAEELKQAELKFLARATADQAKANMGAKPNTTSKPATAAPAAGATLQ